MFPARAFRQPKAASRFQKRISAICLRYQGDTLGSAPAYEATRYSERTQYTKQTMARSYLQAIIVITGTLIRGSVVVSALAVVRDIQTLTLFVRRRSQPDEQVDDLEQYG